MPGVDAGGRAIQRELAHGNAHAARALVPQSQDPLVVGGHDQADIGLRGVAEHGRNAGHVVRRDPDAARPPKDMAVELTGPPHSGRVDNGQQFNKILDQQAVEERLVAVLKHGETDELLQVVGLGSQMLQLQGHLLLDREHGGRHQAVQIVPLAFLVREGRALVV